MRRLLKRPRVKSLWIYPYVQYSASAKAIARFLGIKRIKRKNSKFRPRPWKTIVNWGCSNVPYLNPVNSPEAVRTSANKLHFFQRMAAHDGPRVPMWTTSRDEAQMWCEGGATIVVRKSLTGHSGYGILIVNSKHPEDIPEAPLYTLYVAKASEFRVHIYRGEVIDTQMKRKRHDAVEVDYKVRSHKNGFVFCHDGFETPPDVHTQALKAFRLSGLEFGAVDVGYNDKRQQATVYEINCAPGLIGKTLEKYVEAFRKIIS